MWVLMFVATFAMGMSILMGEITLSILTGIIWGLLGCSTMVVSKAINQ